MFTFEVRKKVVIEMGHVRSREDSLIGDIWDRYYYSHLIIKETEAQGVCISCQGDTVSGGCVVADQT